MVVRTLLIAAVVGSVACGGASAKAPKTGAIGGASRGKPIVALAPGANSGPGIETPGLHVSQEIARLCALPETKGVVPHFDFDSTQLAPTDRDVLALIARCMTDGALRGRAIALVGRTDPRGETEYNMGLGEARSDSVRRYMHDLGISTDRVGSSSRGELDAEGADEEGWALDRRVDITLVSSDLLPSPL
jgi:peptidoglycan-associated lipoprotein